jgi:hypothetical protein
MAQMWDDLSPIRTDGVREVIDYGEFIARRLRAEEPVQQVQQAWTAEDRLADTRSRIVDRAEMLGDIAALVILGAV